MSSAGTAAPSILFSFEMLASTSEDPAEVWQRLLWINASFVIWIDGKEAYREVEFPVVEFASQASAWVSNPVRDFLYNSMESDEEPLLGFYFGPDDILTFENPSQSPVETTADRHALGIALTEFITDLKRRALLDLQIEIGPAF